MFPEQSKDIRPIPLGDTAVCGQGDQRVDQLRRSGPGGLDGSNSGLRGGEVREGNGIARHDSEGTGSRRLAQSTHPAPHAGRVAQEAWVGAGRWSDPLHGGG